MVSLFGRSSPSAQPQDTFDAGLIELFMNRLDAIESKKIKSVEEIQNALETDLVSRFGYLMSRLHTLEDKCDTHARAIRRLDKDPLPMALATPLQTVQPDVVSFTADMSKDAPLYTDKTDFPAPAPAATKDMPLPGLQLSQHLL